MVPEKGLTDEQVAQLESESQGFTDEQVAKMESSATTTPKERLSSVMSGLGEVARRSTQAGPASFLNITGGPLTQIMHDMKAVGLERGLGWSPNAAEAMAGATDPQALIGAIEVAAATGVGRLATSAPGTIERMQALQAAAKGRQIVSKLLPDLDLQSGIKAGGATSAQTEALNLVTKTKKPQDIVNRFAVEKGKVLADRDALITANNKPISLKSVAERAKLLLGRDIENATSKDAKALRAAFEDELSSSAYKNPNFDAVAANKRKSYLYDETVGLQKKQQKGISITVAPEVLKVKDAFAQALKEQVEQIHPDIKKLNARWGALEEGFNAAAKLTERLTEQSPDNLLQRAGGYTLGRLTPGQGVAAAVRELPNLIKGSGKSISKMTGDIEKFSKLAQEASYKSRLKQMERLIRPEDKGRAMTTVKPERGFTMKDAPTTPRTEGGLLEGSSRKGLAGPSERKVLTGPTEDKTKLLGHEVGAGFLTEAQAKAENPLFGYQIQQKKVIGEPVGGLRSSSLSEGGFNKANLKKSVRERLERFNKRNKIK